MLPPAVVEQQAKLGVSAEDSKAQRLKRQQARFRDRGGAFVPSNSNPLVDILLARTVSGESPSKAHPRDVSKRVSPVKGSTVTVGEDSLPVAGTSKRKPAAARRRKTKDTQPEGTETKPVPTRRGRVAKGKKKAPDLDPDTEESLTKPKATSNRKGKQANAVPPTSDGNLKAKKKPATKAKSNPAKEVVGVLDSDDDQTLVDIPRTAKSKSKRSTRRKDEDEIDDDVPVVRKRATPYGDNPKPSGSKITRVKTEKIANTGNLGKKASEGGEEGLQNVKHSKANAKKRLVPHDDDEGADASPPKKGKVARSTSTKPKSDVGSEPKLAPRAIKVVKTGDAKATGKSKREGKAELGYETKDEDDERLPERTTKPRKRKKEENNYDDRPRKAVKFTESGPSHSSSQMLKENQNQSDKNHKRVSKPNSGVKAEHEHEPHDDNDDGAPRPKLVAKVPSRDKMSRGPKGPPREVLERIKASAARYMPCADSEPDELDCLS